MDAAITQKIFLYVIIILSAVFHEYAHSLVAYWLGDNTAKDMGRLTLNPLKHIDPLGTVIVPLVLLFSSGIFIGWAKPVPYNPNNLRDKRYGSLKVGIAGPIANFIIAIILALIIRLSPILGIGDKELFLSLLSLIVYINIFLALFNLIPLPPLDGSKIIEDLFPRSRFYLASMGFVGIFIALFLAFFILSPMARLIFLIFTGQRF